MHDMRESSIASSSKLMTSFRYSDIKYILDKLVAAISIILFAPLVIIICLLIYLNDGESPLFRQVRIGKLRKEFVMFKFRSMKHEKNKLLSNSGTISINETLSEANARYSRTIENDPRVTKVGKWLRKTHLDELPQLFNILLGDMSFVGPRPDVPAQQLEYTNEEWIQRHKVKPGLTGLSQIKASLTASERIKMDLYYVDHINLFHDLFILLSTSLKVLRFNSF